MSKSHVGMGYHLCPVCGIKHDEVVLLDKHLRNTLEPESFVGLKMCAEHQQKYDEGYIALVEVTTVLTANRTGRIGHVAKSAWTALFNCPVPSTPMAFVEPDVLDKLIERYTQDVGEAPRSTLH